MLVPYFTTRSATFVRIRELSFHSKFLKIFQIYLKYFQKALQNSIKIKILQ